MALNTTGKFDYVIELVTDSAGMKRVHIAGTNGGTIRGKGGKKVKFLCGAGVTQFKFVSTELNENDDPAAPLPASPFDPPASTGWVTFLDCTLAKPEKGASQLIFKYSIEVTGATAADPAIIIDK
jgi:hypothetical protein